MSRICIRCGDTLPIWKFPKRVRRHGSLENCRACNSTLLRESLENFAALRLQRTDVARFMAMRNHDSTAANHYQAPGYYSLSDLVALFEKYGFRCAYCGAAADCRDHVVPFFLGGTNWLTNIVPACGTCNNRKGAGTLERFVARWFPGVSFAAFCDARSIPYSATTTSP